MISTPALHPQSLEFSDLTPSTPPGTGAPENGVAGVVGAEPVPCTQAFDENEHRTYAGVMAGLLAIIATALLRLRIRKGFGAMTHELVKLPRQMEHGLYIYTRVKAALKKLAEPIALTVPVKEDGTYVPRYPIYIETDVSPEPEVSEEPQDWAAIDKARGYDVRGTSHVWLERRVRETRAKAIKNARRAFIKANDLTPAKPCKAKQAGLDMERRQRERAALHYKPENGLHIERPEPIPPVYHEVWPPVPAPKLTDVCVTVTAVSAITPAPTMDDIDPRISIDHAYCEYVSRNVQETTFGYVLAHETLGDQHKPP